MHNGPIRLLDSVINLGPILRLSAHSDFFFQKREEKPANMFSIYISLFFEPSHSGNGVSYFSNVCSTIDDLYSDKVTDMEFLHIKLKELFDTRCIELLYTFHYCMLYKTVFAAKK